MIDARLVLLTLAVALSGCGDDASTPQTVSEPRVAEERMLSIRIDAERTAHVSKLGHPRRQAASISLRIDPETYQQNPTRIQDALYDVLWAQARGAVREDGVTAPRIVLSLRAAPGVPWADPLRVFFAATSPGVGIHTVDLLDQRGDRVRRIDPVDTKLAEILTGKSAPAEPEERAVRVKATRRQDHYTLLVLHGGDDFTLGPDTKPDAYADRLREFREALADHVREHAPAVFVLNTPPDDHGGAVPCRDIWNLLRLAGDLGLKRVKLIGTPFRRIWTGRKRPVHR